MLGSALVSFWLHNGDDWVQRITKQKGLIIEQHRTKLDTLRVQMEMRRSEHEAELGRILLSIAEEEAAHKRTVASIESIIEEEGRAHEIELKRRDDERRAEASRVEA